MQTLDDMLGRRLLSREQHSEIRSWIAQAKTPDAIMEMPPRLWRALALASMLMGFDAEVTQDPPLGGFNA
jgi:hypothetical protein